jgi:hypothetical protein
MVQLRSGLLSFAVAGLLSACSARGRPTAAPVEESIPTAPDASAASSVHARSPPADFPVGTWSGHCEGGGTWSGGVDAKLTFFATGSIVRVTGMLAFVGRTTDADLSGEKKGNRFELKGSMTEIDSPRTEWNLELTVAAVRPGDEAVSGTFREVTPSWNVVEMCSFAWSRPGQRAR